MKLRGLFILLVLGLNNFLSKAQQSFAEKSELGVFAGGSYYTGDLNRLGHFRQLSFAGGILYRYNLNPRVALRASGYYGKIKGNDAQSRHSFYQNRNLNFNSILVEGAFGLEFNYLTYVTGRTYGERYWFSPYMFIQLSAFYFNPKTEYEGKTYELQPLGTEGQGTTLSRKSNYRRIQPSIPVGLGIKLNLTKRIQFTAEYGIRLTFTDYLDDVSGVYVDPVQLALINGEVAAALSDRSLKQIGFSGRNVGMRRGDGAFNDWYSFFGVGLTLKLGQRAKCPMREQ
jgi:hypothetical protein